MEQNQESYFIIITGKTHGPDCDDLYLRLESVRLHDPGWVNTLVLHLREIFKDKYSIQIHTMRGDSETPAEVTTQYLKED